VTARLLEKKKNVRYSAEGKLAGATGGEGRARN